MRNFPSLYSLCSCPSISVRPQRKYIFGMSFPFSCLIRLPIFLVVRRLFCPQNVSSVYGGNPRPTHLRHGICLKFSHCHHRNYLYNPHIQSHYPESSSQGLASNLEVTLMTETEFLLPQRRQFPTPFCLFFFARSPGNIHARVSRVMAQFFLKIAHLSFSMGPTPLLKMVFSYGLRPRLWLLAEAGKKEKLKRAPRAPVFSPQPSRFPFSFTGVY